jgi:acyl carrier protein
VSVEDRLAACFTAVFPELDPSEVATASTETVEPWDSLASLTLVAVIEEEFEVAIDDLDLSELGSYAAFRDYLQRASPATPTGRDGA